MKARGMPGHMIRRLQQISTQVFVRQMQAAGFDLTPVKFATMDAILFMPGMDRAGVAAAILYDAKTIGPVIDQLANAGYAKYDRSDSDPTTEAIFATEKGAEMFRVTLPIVTALQNDVLPGLSRSEKAQFFALARKAIDMAQD